jgi:hypothetical protein
MGSMRVLILGLIVSISLLAPAAAAQGYKSKVTTTISLSDAFFKAADPYGHAGLGLGEFTIPPVTGMLYLAGDRMRMDMNAPTGTITTLFDGQAGYMLDTQKQVAWKMATPQSNAGEIPLFNLDQVATNWELVSGQLGRTAGLTTKKLGKKKLSGLGCTGVRFSGDIRKLLDADEVQEVPGMPSLSNLKGNWTGTFWVSEKLGLPVKMTSSFSGISIAWQLADIQNADIPETMLKLPPGYKVKKLASPQSSAGAS